jgi:NhaC family Na+:H+ antiporter
MRYIITALIIGYFVFLLIGIRMGYSIPDIFRMSLNGLKTALTLMIILLLIGVLTGSWRSAGSIVTFIYYGIQLIKPRLFLVVTFVLTCLMSYALGTSFGVAGTAGVIFMALARSGGVDPTITAGVILSGIYFGDRTSPASSTAFTVASVTGTDLYTNVRNMLKTGLIPWLICLAVYSFLSIKSPLAAVDHEVMDAFESVFNISAVTLIPAAIILIFPLIHVPILITLGSSIAAAAAVSLTVQKESVASLIRTMILGYHSPVSEISSVIDGGGMISMLGTVVIVALACSYTGIMNGTGMIELIRNRADRLTARIGLFPSMILISLISSSIFCNQVVAIIMSKELLQKSYETSGKAPEELAIDIENTAITLPSLIPWCILCSVPLAILGVTYAAVPFAIYSYAIPLVNLIGKYIHRT